MTKCHGLEPKDSYDENNVGYEQNNAPNDHTPIITGDDTNILRVNNINNNNIRA